MKLYLHFRSGLYRSAHLKHLYSILKSFQIWTEGYRQFIVGGIGEGRAWEKKGKDGKFWKSRVIFQTTDLGLHFPFKQWLWSCRKHIWEPTILAGLHFPHKTKGLFYSGMYLTSFEVLIIVYGIILKIITVTYYFSLCFFVKREGWKSIPGGFHEWGRNSCGTSWHEASL